MKICVETQRLILRELLPEDAEDMLALNSDPEVMRYLGNKPITTLSEAIAAIDVIKAQYEAYGIGRWAVIEKVSQQFIGWAGLKWHTDEVNGHSNYFDVGYRLIKHYWGKGYATEAAKASMQYGFNQLQQEVLYAMADVNNTASVHVLTKAGFIKQNTLMYEGSLCYWFKAVASAG
ncbi:GNAT family N-acetyltransferase [Mucilaginibacter sp.]